MFNFNYLFSSFPSHSSLNFNREVALSHASFLSCGQDDQGDLDDKNKKKKNKGRHTKIRTASGVRDRRVRLSMEVSRKFFDLQDALGLDTASDTLEWLISESGNAIEEVKLATDHLPGRCPYNFPGENAAARGCDQAEKEARRECRARARARARERTQAKRKQHSDDWSDLLP